MEQETVTPVVGRKFKTRDGSVVTVMECDTSSIWPFRLDCEASVTAEGREWRGESHPNDLVEMLADAVAPVDGGQYRCRNGQVVTAVRDHNSESYPFDLTEDGIHINCVTAEGREWENRDSDHDLVERLDGLESDGLCGPRPEQTLRTPSDDLLALFDSTVAQCRETMVRKNHDYTSGSSDPLANFSASEIVGVERGKGILVRSIDKHKRIQTFIEQDSLQVADESVADAIMDVINYMILLRYSFER